MTALRKALALLCAGSLLLGSLPPSALAQPTAPINAALAMRQMRDWGVYADGNPALKSYLGDERRLTWVGEAIYRSLLARRDPQAEAPVIRRTLENLSRGGAYDASRRRAVELEMASLQARFGPLPQGADCDLECSYRLSVERDALLARMQAASADGAAQSYTQVAGPGGSVEFYDARGLAVAMTRDRRVTFSRDLRDAQREMNRDPLKPARAAFIPETGVYSIQMLDYGYFRLDDQYDAFLEAVELDRLMLLASLLHKQIPPEDFTRRRREVREELEEEARRTTYTVRGGRVSVLELAARRMADRAFYLQGSFGAVEAYRLAVEALRGREIGEEAFQAVSRLERGAQRWLSLAALAAQDYQLRGQIDAFDPDSPESRALMEAIGHLPEGQRADYLMQGRRLLERLRLLQGMVRGVRDTLLADEGLRRLEEAQRSMGAIQSELSEALIDQTLYVSGPVDAYTAAGQAGLTLHNGQLQAAWGDGWDVSGWFIHLLSGLPGSYGRDLRRAEAMVPRWREVINAVARGDFGAARELALALDPEAFRRLRRGSATGEAPLTMADRVAAAVTSTEQMLGDLGKTNEVVRATANFAIWSVGLGTFAGGIRFFAGLGARIPIAPLAAPFQHLEARMLIRAQASAGAIPAAWARLPGGSFLYATGVGTMNAALRQAGFTGMAGVMSGGMSIYTYASAPYTSGFDNWQEAWSEGFRGGAVWANDAWHPALNYIGLPSTVFEGVPLAAGAAESLAARGFIGNATAIGRAAGLPRWIAWDVEAALGRLTARGGLSQFGGTALAMADQMLKYGAFAQAMGFVGRQASWRATENIDDVERRIRIANAEGLAWEMAPLWLVLPVFPAVGMQAGREVGLAMEGAKALAERPGGLAELLNAQVGETRIHIPGWKPRGGPLDWMDASVGTGQKSTHIIATQQAVEWGVGEFFRRRLGGGKKQLGPEHLPELVRVMRLADNAPIGDGVVASQAVKAATAKLINQIILRDPALLERVLSAPDGSVVPGFGEITGELRGALTAGLLKARSEGTAIPPRILERLREQPAARRLIESDRLPKPFARRVIELFLARRGVSERERSWARWHRQTVRDWEAGRGEAAGLSQPQLMAFLRREAGRRRAAGELTAAEFAHVEAHLDYISSTILRQQSFNNADTVSRVEGELTAEARLRLSREPARGGERPGAALLERIHGLFSGWEKGFRARHQSDPKARVDKAGSDGTFESEVVRPARELLEKAENLTPREREILTDLVGGLETSPWAIRDAKGEPMFAWRDKQFAQIHEHAASMIGEGHGGRAFRSFDLMSMGGGKTLYSMEYLLPMAEARAELTGKTLAFLTLGPLKAQVELDFLGYRKLSTNLLIETLDGIKGRIAEGKIRGKSVAKDFVFLIDEHDAGGQRARTSIGGTTGSVPHETSLARLLQELAEGPLKLIDELLSRGRAAEAARSLRLGLEGLRGPKAEEARAAADRVLEAAAAYETAKGPADRARAEARLREESRVLRARLEELPAELSEAGAEAGRALGELERALSPPPADPARLASLEKETRSSMTRQDNLLEGPVDADGLQSLARETRARRFALENEIIRLEEALPGAGTSAEAARIRTQLEGAREALRLVEEVENAIDPGARGVRLSQELVTLDWRIERLEARRGELAAAGKVRELAALEGGLSRLTARRAEVRGQLEALESGLPPQKRSAFQRHRDLLRQELEASAGMRELARAEERARRAGQPRVDLAKERHAREQILRSLRDRILREEAELSAGAADAPRSQVLQRLRILRGQIAEAEGQAAAAEAAGSSPAAHLRRAADLRREADILSNRAARGARAALGRIGRRIERLVAERPPGWELQVRRLIEMRTELARSLVGGPNRFYELLRNMKERVSERYAEGMADPDPVKAEAARERYRLARDGEPFLLALPQWLVLMWDVFRGRTPRMDERFIERVGLTRYYSAYLLREALRDPYMPPGQREYLFWSIAPSLFRGGRGSWVGRMLDQFLAANIAIRQGRPLVGRLDPVKRIVAAVHEGEFHTNMDIEARRYFELENGVDVTLPYSHREVATIRDIERADFMGFSGTGGRSWEKHVGEFDTRVSGRAADLPPEGQRVVVLRDRADITPEVHRALLERVERQSQDLVVVRPGDLPAEVLRELEPYLAARRNPDLPDIVVRISEAPPGARRALQELRARRARETGRENTGLLFIAVSDLGLIAGLRDYLIREVGLKPEEITEITGEGGYYESRYPGERADRRANLEGVATGRTRVVIGHAPMMGRGLNLALRRGGYTHIEQILIAPEQMAQVHMSQTFGRIAVDRVLPGAERSFTLLTTIEQARYDAVFRRMIEEDPFFVRAREELGPEATWEQIDAWVREHGAEPLPGDYQSRAGLRLRFAELESALSRGLRSGDGVGRVQDMASALRQDLAVLHRETVRREGAGSEAARRVEEARAAAQELEEAAAAYERLRTARKRNSRDLELARKRLEEAAARLSRAASEDLGAARNILEEYRAVVRETIFRSQIGLEEEGMVNSGASQAPARGKDEGR